MAKVYLETSFVSACVRTRTDAGSVYRREASLAWWAAQRPLHELAISAEVIYELSDPDYPQRDDALAFVGDLEPLMLTPEVVGLASVFVRERVMPAPAVGDATHVAAATWHRADYMLSWNVRHLANPKKVQHLTTICLRLGLVPPRILTPDLLWEDSDDDRSTEG